MHNREKKLPCKQCTSYMRRIWNMSIFKGSGVALVTPMKENGEINYE